jgi:hypothetical protein
LLSGPLIVSAVVLFFMSRIPAGDQVPGVEQLLIGFAFAVFLATPIVGVPAAYIGMITIGVPAWLFLRFTNNESGAGYSVTGALGGWWLAPALGGRKWEGFPLDWIGAAGGALALFLFWRIARRR